MQNQFKYIYNGEEVSKDEFQKLSVDTFKMFDGNSIISVPFNSFLEEFNNTRELKTNSTRHKCKEDGKFHKDDVINNINRGEKDTIDYLNTIQKHKNEDLYDVLKRCLDNSEDTNKTQKDIKNKEYLKFPMLDKEQELKGVKDSQTVKKAPIFTFCKQMKNAIEQLAFRSEYGHNRYKEFDIDWNNFARVENGDEEYANASFRHALGVGEDSELDHYIASAWNSIARLEIYLRKNLQN